MALPISAAIVFVNYYGDAASLFDRGYEKQMADIIENRKYVTNVSEFDDRLFQRELIISEKIHPRVAVFGSSRAMLISADIYGDSLLLNNSVYFACIEDVAAIYQIYKSNNKLPEKIIIGVDPWLFSENAAHIRWKSIASYYYAFTGKSDDNIFNSKYAQLFSLSYFQSSLRTLPNKIRGYTKPMATNKKFNTRITRLTDGSVVYGESYRNTTPKQVDEIITLRLSEDQGNSSKLYVISTEFWSLFERLISDMKTNNIEVEFFLSPFPVRMYNKRADNYKEIEDAVKKYAATQHIKVFGTYNANMLNMDNSYFMDERHCNEKAIKEIFRNNN